MKIIFCEDPAAEKNPDSMYIDEVAAATHAGLDFELINYESLVDHHNAARAVREIPARSEVETAIYRGWALTVRQYTALYDALLSRGLRLLNNAQQYKFSHYLPQSLPAIQAHTPHTVWMETDGKRLSYDAIMQLLLPFAGRPLILKDFVKSEKHYWYEACYISSASDFDAVRNTIQRFLELRGENFTGGLVFREFVEFMPLAEHPRSQMPLTKEYRLFFLNAMPLATVRYWDVEGYDNSDEPPPELFSHLIHGIRSNFFTMDIAQRTDGEWLIIELGDGQIARLPDDMNIDFFYEKLAEIV